jgi:iron complex transport system substrate-binding protein
MARNYMQFDEADVDELAANTGPFVTPFNVYIFADWQSDHPTTIYEVFEQMSRVFREEDKYEAFAALHDEVISDVQSRLPPEDERPTVAIINAASSPGNGEFYPSTIDTPGTAMKPYRDLKLNDALADVETTDGTFDYETMLEIDPEVIAVAWQIAVPDEQFTENFVTPFENDSLGQQLQAVQNDRVIKGQHFAQGPVINLFQTEYVAKQYYPDVFGEWPDNGVVPEDERLFDRQRVADIINGEI